MVDSGTMLVAPTTQASATTATPNNIAHMVTVSAPLHKILPNDAPSVSTANHVSFSEVMAFHATVKTIATRHTPILATHADQAIHLHKVTTRFVDDLTSTRFPMKKLNLKETMSTLTIPASSLKSLMLPACLMDVSSKVRAPLNVARPASGQISPTKPKT
jgi:hypothetical protein